MPEIVVALRSSTIQDSPALGSLHRDAWRNAYRGIIPGVALERMLARRGAAWWEHMHRQGRSVLVVDLSGEPAGYAMLGPARGARGGGGEIYELYMRPDCQGIGLGRRLFEASWQRLQEAGCSSLVVWALIENTIACRFYRAMGGTEGGRAHALVGGKRLEKISFRWT